jgi:hypothetical protein
MLAQWVTSPLPIPQSMVAFFSAKDGPIPQTLVVFAIAKDGPGLQLDMGPNA